MKLLVFASTPPPVHGQSAMVQTLLDGLPQAAPELKIFHVNVRLSHTTADIGRFRVGKILALLAACFRALRLRLHEGPIVFYYVPAPGKRAALFRDWVVMLLCRPFFPALVLHWHAVGLGEWITQHASPPERWLTRRLLGRASLSIVLAPELADDARQFHPRAIAIVPNGIADPLPIRSPLPSAPRSGAPMEILYLGLGSRAKGLFDTLDALRLADQREPGRYRLTVAGAFATAADAAEFHRQRLALGPDRLRYAGFAELAQKQLLLASADVLCFPTTYPHEGQPLVLLEALAHDLPILTTRHRAIPGMLPDNAHVRFVPPHAPDAIAAALTSLRASGPRDGSLRAHYLHRFTRDAHLATLASALRALAPSTRA